MFGIKIDLAHNNLVQQAPLFLMMAFTFISLLPPIPQQFRLIILIIGMVSGIGGLFSMDLYARIEGVNYNVIKARIRPSFEEVEFFVTAPEGKIPSKLIDKKRRIYRTYWKLGRPVELKDFGEIDGEIEIDSKLPWDIRCKPNRAWVTIFGMEIFHPNVYQVELWIPETFNKRINFNTVVPRFNLASGTEDYNLKKTQTIDKIGLR